MQFHNTLNKKIWKNDRLRAEVALKLKLIARAFIEFLEIPNNAVKDIRITGSSANYNYTPNSDLDLHIIVDYNQVHKNCPLVEGYLWAKKAQFNKEHDIKIYGIPVEMYAEDSRTPAVSNGTYSLKFGKWLKVPERIKPKVNDTAVKAKYEEMKEAIENCGNPEEAKEILEKLYTMRRNGLSKEGEFSTENLAFKKLRNEGLVDKLKQVRKDSFDKELTLEDYNLIWSEVKFVLENFKDF